jgi:hypothetical protein
MARSGYSAVVKEAMAMRDGHHGHLLKRAGREFARNLLWMAVVLGVLAAILVAATDLPLAGVMVFVGGRYGIASDGSCDLERSLR